MGDVQTGPSWSGKEINPECGFAVYLQESGEKRPHLPAKGCGEDFALQVNP